MHGTCVSALPTTRPLPLWGAILGKGLGISRRLQTVEVNDTTHTHATQESCMSTTVHATSLTHASVDDVPQRQQFKTAPGHNQP